MSVSETTAERLLPYAKGPALDLLFRRVRDGDIRMTDAPSSALVRERWTQLSASMAISIVKAITDTELLDYIAAREKRKTVRAVIVSNEHLHPVTRMYYLQEGLRGSDWDLIRGSLRHATSDELLGYIAGDSSLGDQVHSSAVASALLGSENLETVRAAVAKMSRGGFLSYVDYMFSQDSAKTFALLETLGMSTEGHHFHRVFDKGSVSIELMRHLLATSGDTQRFSELIAYSLSNDIEQLVQVNPEMLDLVETRRLELSVENAEVFIKNGKISRFLHHCRERGQVSEELGDLIGRSVTTEKDRVSIALLHPVDASAAALIGEYENFAATAKEFTRANDYVRWVRRVAPHVGLPAVVELLRGSNPATLNRALIEALAESFERSVDDIVASLPDEVLASVDSLPPVSDRLALMNRAAGIEGASQHIALCVLDMEGNDPRVESVAINILIDNNNYPGVARWLKSASEEQVATLLPHRAAFLAEAFKDRSVRRSASWCGLIIGSIAPVEGWGAMVSSDITSSAMKHLNALVGDDAKLWETVLGLFETWTGTLDSLVDAAKTL